MAKRIALSTRAFGAEPGEPDAAALAGWIAEHRGSRLADLLTYRIDSLLAQQIAAGIATPCAGGKFYRERILSSIDGLEGIRVFGELHLDTPDLVEDAAGIVVRQKGAWCALPAPHLLGLSDTYYLDPAEWSDAITGMYRSILRTMRDTGVAGHVLVCDRIDPAELRALFRPNVFFFLPEPDRPSLTRLLEKQQKIAVRKDSLDLVFSLLDVYDIHLLYILDPDEESIGRALAHLDPDRVACGGYGTSEPDYWKNLAESAFYIR